MNRRGFLKLLAMGVVGHELDIDRLLWLPGQKKIFLPSTPIIGHITTSQIIAIELERILPHMKSLFERDDLFYKTLSNGHYTVVDGTNHPVRIPLKIKPGAKYESH